MSIVLVVHPKNVFVDLPLKITSTFVIVLIIAQLCLTLIEADLFSSQSCNGLLLLLNVFLVLN